MSMITRTTTIIARSNGAHVAERDNRASLLLLGGGLIALLIAVLAVVVSF